jgi:threonine-phosphate decarboxylase
MYEYVHGGDIYSVGETNTGKILDFSANINPLGLPEEVKTAIWEAIKACENYPDPFCRQLVSALAEYEDVEQDKIFCANGASEIIFRLALGVKPKKALLLAPTFADYEKALQTIGCAIEYYYLSAENDFLVKEDYLSQLNESTDIVCICNPNNPTGQLCDKAFLKTVLAKGLETNTLVLVDECFIDFIDKPEEYSVQVYLKDFPNLIILKAFTKIYAMPGIRLGYALTSNTTLPDVLRLSGQDWSVSTIAQAAGLCALKQKNYIWQTKSLIKSEREFLIAKLKELGLEVFGSQANYIFFKTDGSVNLATELLARGILIRSCSNYVNLHDGYYRIAVKTRNENLSLIRSIEEVLAK